MSFFTDARHRRLLTLWLLGALPCLLLAAYTQHRWEDWYIMFRSAKNLAAGQGFVYQPGELLQTFSSPLNALLAAGLSWLTGNRHDGLVIWLYRLVSAGLLGGTVLLLDRLARREAFAGTALCFLIGLFVVDGKTADFAINGMETAFVVFFLALAVLALLQQRAVWLGLAWAGLMWSRPDSVIYIAGTSLGWLFAGWRAGEPPAPALHLLLRAALIAALCYGPWFAWSWWYYGSPVPQSVMAKGLNGTPFPLPTTVGSLLLFPVASLLVPGNNALADLFTPAYMSFGDWPSVLGLISRSLGWVAALAWLLPRSTMLVRTTSFGLFCGIFYLQFIAPYAYPWYFPPCTLLACLTLAGLLQRLWLAAAPPWRHGLQAAAAALVLLWLGVSLAMAVQMRTQQTVIENQRHDIGLWLKAHAASEQDSVLLECMGYIGFYSGLKVYDYPGIVSREMVAARRVHGEDIPVLIAALRPDWLVLRPEELAALSQNPLQAAHYRQVQVFDQSAAVAAPGFLPGRGYLRHDQTFIILQRTPEPGQPG